MTCLSDDLLPRFHLLSGYSALVTELSSDSFRGADSFYVRVNLDLCLREQPGLSVSCNDILHVTDTRYNGRYQWRCARVDVHSGKALQNGAVPNYNRYRSLVLMMVQTKLFSADCGVIISVLMII